MVPFLPGSVHKCTGQTVFKATCDVFNRTWLLAAPKQIKGRKERRCLCALKDYLPLQNNLLKGFLKSIDGTKWREGECSEEMDNTLELEATHRGVRCPGL